eukprot:4527460-Pyramimonas_sp.AAC.1
MDKSNGEAGILGRRVMHCYCAWPLGFHSGMRRRAPPVQRPYLAHGGPARKCREDVLITITSCRLRILSLGHSHTTTNFDCANAFGCTSREKLEGVARAQSLEGGIPFAVGAIEHASMTIKGSDEEISLMPRSGSQMGFCLAPRDFNDC